MRKALRSVKVPQSKANVDSSVGLSQSDGASGGLCGSDSDSDSIFLTQKCVPEAERSRKALHRKSSRPREDFEAASSSCGSTTKSTKHKKRQKWSTRLPEYSFYLHPVKSNRTTLNTHQNMKLHNAVLRGFFNSVSELWENSERGIDLLSSLPTIDQDGDFILPISEEDETLEDETSENEDIKVVAKTHFVIPSKTKNRPPLDDPTRRDSQVTPQSNGGAGASQEGQSEASDNLQTTIRSGEEDSSLPVKGKRPMSSMPVLDKTRSSTVERNMNVQEKEVEGEMCTDSDATVSDLNPEECTAKVVGASTAETERHTDASQAEKLPGSGERESGGQHLLPRDSDSGSLCIKSRVRKRKKKKREGGDCGSVAEGKSQVEDESTAFSVNVRVKGKKETLNLSQTIRDAESLSRDDGEKETEYSKQEEKRRKSRSAAENVDREMDGIVASDARVEVDSVASGTCVKKVGGKKKKKKRERKENEGQLKSDEASESVVCQETSDSGSVKEQKNKKSSSNDGEDCDILNISNGVISQAVSPQLSVKKKKKRARNKDGEQLKSDKASDSLKDEIRKSQKEGSRKSCKTSELAEEPRDCSENKEASLETLDSGSVKRRKKKKKHQSKSNDGEDCDILNVSNGVISRALSPQLSTKKKKKKRERNQNSEQVKSDKASDSLKDDVEIRKSKKKSGKESYMTSVQAEESRDCVENTEVSPGTSDSESIQEKDSNKKHRSKSNDGENCYLLNVSNDIISQALSPQSTGKKKKKRREKNEDGEPLKSDKASDSPKEEIRKSQKEGSRKSCKTSELADEPRDCSGNNETSLETFDSGFVKSKKKKKKRQSKANDGEDCDTLNVSNGDISRALSPQLSTKKKKKKRERNENEEQLKSDKASDSPKDEIWKSQKDGNKKSCKTSELAGESRDCSQNTETSLETSDSGSFQKKKKKKKHQSSDNGGKDSVLVTVSNGVISPALSPQLSEEKKKKRNTSENVDISPDREEGESADNTQKATEGIEDEDTQLPTKLKKKKKLREESILDICTDPVAQSDDSASAKKKKSSSSLEADAVETAKLTVLSTVDSTRDSAEISESLPERDRVRKKKRKMEAVVKEMDVEEPNQMPQGGAAGTEVRRKKTKLTAPIDVSDNAEYSQIDEDEWVKNKRRKDVEFEKSATLREEKGLTVIAQVENTSQCPHKHQNQASNDVSGRKNKRKSTESLEADVMEVGFSVNSPSLLEMSSHSAKKSKQSKAKKKLYNPSKDFFTLS